MSAHFKLEREGAVAVVRLDRPERKNPFTFQSYAALREYTTRTRKYGGLVDPQPEALRG